MKEEKEIKYEEYTYEENQEVGSIDLLMFNKISELAHFVIQNGTHAGFELKGTIEDTFGPTNLAKQFCTPEAMIAYAVLERMHEMHHKNVETGKAKHYTELQQEVGGPEVDNPLKVV